MARSNKGRRLLHHPFDHLAYRLEVIFLRLAKLVHVEMIPAERELLRCFALIQTS